jgi:uncharacterized membrane protein
MLDFILQSQKRKARRFRLKEWLLLAIRTAMVLALAGLGAHPVVTQAADLRGESTLGHAYPSHLVLILDTSMSMRFQDGEGVRFETAKEWLKGLVSPMRGTNIAVLTTDSTVSRQPAVEVFTPGPREALRALNAVQPTYGEANVLGAFQSAFGLLRTFPGGLGGGKEILFLTDGTANGWEKFSSARLEKVDPDVKVRVIRWGPKQGNANVAVSEVSLAENDAILGQEAVLRAVIRNYGQEDQTLPVELWGGKEVERKTEERTVRVSAGGQTEVEFHARLADSGYLPGKVQLRSEGLTADDAYHFTLFVRERPSVLLVDGDPKSSLLGSETFYLMNALSPKRGIGVSPFRTRWIPTNALNLEEIGKADLLVLANVDGLPANLREGIADFVRNGGGLLWFLGDRVSPEKYDSLLRPKGLLPARFLDIRESPSGGRNGGEEIQEIQGRHPALRIFSGLGKAAFSGSRFRKYVGMVESPSSEVLMRLQGGAPLLVEGELGKGRVMVFASTADRDWNDFSIRASYLPFLHNLFLYLGCRACPSGEIPKTLGEGVTIGETWTLQTKISLVGKPLRLTGPGGFERTMNFLAGKDQGAGRAVVRFRTDGEVGVYGAEHEGEMTLFAVNPPAAESDLAPLPDSELKAKFGELGLEALWREEIPDNYNPWRRSRTDFTAVLLWSLLGLAAAEVLVGGRQ